jgi:hypothetical protein
MNRRKRLAPSIASLLLILFWLFNARLLAQTAPPPPQQKPFPVIIWNVETEDLAGFELAAQQAKAAGATHMVVSGNLPTAFWEYDTPGDPYPAWYIHHPGLLKVFPPDAMRPYIPADYADKVSGILASRCAILQKYGLQGVFISNEPQVLPEKVFTDHPLWRGPRVDQPNRSRVARFAPAADEPEVLQLYRQSVAALKRRCPQITLFDFVTTDAGSGLDWAPSLYPGPNGPARFKTRSMTDRVRDFLAALQDGAHDAAAAAPNDPTAGQLQIRLRQISPEEWMVPTFADPQALARQLTKGLAIDNFEAPAATPFIASAGGSESFGNFFYPVRGIPRPVEVAESLRTAWTSHAPRLTFGLPEECDDLYSRLFSRFTAQPALTSVAQAQLLSDLALDEVGPGRDDSQASAEDLVGVWQSLSNAAQVASTLKWCYPFNMGGVHQRWLTRPFVPFPGELPAAQKAYYRKFIFEARTEEQADDLVDNQAMELYEGWAGRMWITNVFNYVEPQIKTARRHLADLIPHLPPERRASCEQLDLRLQMVLCLATNARDAVNYQAVLDYIKGRNIAPDMNPPLGTQPSWDRQMILDIARDEIDNSAAIIDLLKKQPDLLYTAKTPGDEDIMLLGADLPAQLKTKMDIMNAHWEDYKRLTTTPNQ